MIKGEGRPTKTLSDQGRASLDNLLQIAVERRDVPGVVAEVADRKQTLYRGAFGTRDERKRVAMPEDALFEIKSMTKPVTSVAIMMLEEQGLLDLDDPAGDYVPDLRDATVFEDYDEPSGTYTTRPADRDITLHDLLTHTAGFGYEFTSPILTGLSGRLPMPPPLLHDPGCRWTYGSSTYYLGKIIEQVTGESLDTVFESHIFKPLGMKDTGFDLKPEDHDRHVSLFKRVGERLIWVQPPSTYRPQIFGDQGLLATAGDYIRFLQMLLNEGRFDDQQLLTKASIGEMISNQIGSLVVGEQSETFSMWSNPFPLGAGEDKFGLGFQLKEEMEEDARSPGSCSWSGLYNTHFWFDPEEGIAAVLMTQVLPFYEDRCIRLLTDFERHIYMNLIKEQEQ